MIFGDLEYQTKLKDAQWKLNKGWYNSAAADLEKLVAVAASKDPGVGILLEQAREGAAWTAEGKMPATPVDPMQYKEVQGGLPD